MRSNVDERSNRFNVDDCVDPVLMMSSYNMVYAIPICRLCVMVADPDIM